ncbi:caspase family protein [Raineya orbicola]|jgi:hypothetical protein|uniref:Caspase domain n=1 Tax=Raineya orbicola TaxID=2016530 RepID=A0A2N3IEX6_9BACT|nr:caspase family protein [Raineya orbicola]PKQ68882.1 Caspase domain [Raineya orbicola]
MKKQLLRRIGLLFFLFAFANAKGQSLYEIVFEASDITYKAFLVYFNEQDAYMRIGYTYKGKYNVVDVKYQSVTGQEDGYNYLVMVGSNPRFITNQEKGQSYNPDHFIWVWNDQNPNQLPYVTDDPNFDASHLIQCKSYIEIDPKTMTDSYLRQFFRTDEPEYQALRKMRDASAGAINYNTSDNNSNSGSSSNNNNNNTGSGKSKMHLLLVINTDIGDIGQSCAVDQKAMEVEFREIAKAVGMPFEKYIINGEKFTRDNVERTIKSMQVGNNDVVIFYYSGHGFRWSNQTDKYPQLDMRYSEYTPLTEKTSLPLSAAAKAITDKGGRLNIILSDCCNSDIGRNQMTSTTFMASRSFQGAEIQKLKKLFIDSRGSIMITGSSPGEYSWCNINGGFFTLSFIQALKEEIGYMRTGAPSWEHIAENAVRSTQYKAKNCNGCKPQNPVSAVRVSQR